MSEIWATASAVLAALGGGTLIVLAASTWLGKIWASRILESDRARYQSVIEGLKADLSKKIHEHNVAVSRLDYQQAEIIQKLYYAFIDWFEVALEIRAPDSIIHDDPTAAKKRYSELGRELQRKAQLIEQLSMYAAIYLKPETHHVVVKCGYSASELSISFCDKVINSSIADPIEMETVLEDAVAKLDSGYRETFEPARDALISHFRRALDPRIDSESS